MKARIKKLISAWLRNANQQPVQPQPYVNQDVAVLIQHEMTISTDRNLLGKVIEAFGDIAPATLVVNDWGYSQTFVYADPVAMEAFLKDLQAVLQEERGIAIDVPSLTMHRLQVYFLPNED